MDNNVEQSMDNNVEQLFDVIVENNNYQSYVFLNENNQVINICVFENPNEELLEMVKLQNEATYYVDCTNDKNAEVGKFLIEGKFVIISDKE
jgi:hypothetical protein